MEERGEEEGRTEGVTMWNEGGDRSDGSEGWQEGKQRKGRRKLGWEHIEDSHKQDRKVEDMNQNKGRRNRQDTLIRTHGRLEWFTFSKAAQIKQDYWKFW